MDFQFIEKYVPLYVVAGKLTLCISCIGIVLSILIGILASAVLYYRIPLLKRLVSVYVELSRNTPLLVQLFFLYFGLPKIGIRWSSEVCGIVGLSFLGGAYMTGGTQYGGKGAVGIGKGSWTESYTDFAICASSGSNHSCRSFDCCEYDFPDQRDLGF